MERTEAMSEMRARDTLYGPQTRSGQVNLTPLQPDEFGRPAGLSDEWIPWDSISWDDPRPGHSVQV
jgi:hypothetical protein